MYALTIVLTVAAALIAVAVLYLRPWRTGRHRPRDVEPETWPPPEPETLSLGEQPHNPEHCDRGGQPHLGPCVDPAETLNMPAPGEPGAWFGQRDAVVHGTKMLPAPVPEGRDGVPCCAEGACCCSTVPNPPSCRCPHVRSGGTKMLSAPPVSTEIAVIDPFDQQFDELLIAIRMQFAAIRRNIGLLELESG